MVGRIDDAAGRQCAGTALASGPSNPAGGGPLRPITAIGVAAADAIVLPRHVDDPVGRQINRGSHLPAGWIGRASGGDPVRRLRADLSDALLNRTADDLARLGWIVLIPSTPRLREGLLSPEDADVLVAAFQWLTQRSDVNPGRVGYAGFCVGSSLALVAAADPRINEQVAYVHTFGGYCDAASELRAICDWQHAQSSSGDQPWQPAPGALTLYIQNLLTHVESPAIASKSRRLSLAETPWFRKASRPSIRRSPACC